MKHLSYPSLICFLLLVAGAYFWPSQGSDIDLMAKLQPPSITYWFGTDWLGRDQFSRTMKALISSLQVGGIAALMSSMIAFSLAIIASTHQRLAWFVDLLVDTMMSLPHLLLLILLTLALEGSSQGVIFAITLSHWPRLTRLLRAEVIQLTRRPYVLLARNFGKPYWQVLVQHMVPHLLPQWLTGLLLLIPHAILHAAALTFLGFGLNPNEPSMGILLSEASRYLIIGNWWLALFPGLVLITALLLLAENATCFTRSLRKGQSSC
ncbi:ABC transporter permease [Moritella dasanensis]|jgi:peptide/nickel transport system permease protein|uniref:ABC transporter permease n=1 Tax=Moritella dasanensis TaxID=428031 RepID=UPI00030A2162|nr:ABC transporter permease [Moritella dasanensis]